MVKTPDNVRLPQIPKRAFEQPDEDAGIHAARERFLAVVHRVEPRVSGDLMREPLDLYRPLAEATIARLQPEQRERPGSLGFLRAWGSAGPYWSSLKHASDRHDPPEMLELRDRLLRWSEKWGLTAEWCLEAAVDTLWNWSRETGEPTPGPLYYLGASSIELPFGEDELRFTFSHRGWQPTLEDWKSASAWMDECYKAAKQEYKARVEQLSRDAGLVPLPGSKVRMGEQMEWLALKLVKPTAIGSYAKTAKRIGGTRQGVGQAAKKQARLLGLTIPNEE